MDAKHSHRPYDRLRVRPVQLPTTNIGTAGGLIVAGRVRLFGWNLQDTSGSANLIHLQDNTQSGGLSVCSVPIPASTYATSMPSEPGVLFELGIWAYALGNSVHGRLYVSDVSDIGYGGREDDELAELEALASGQGIKVIPGRGPYGH